MRPTRTGEKGKRSGRPRPAAGHVQPARRRQAGRADAGDMTAYESFDKTENPRPVRQAEGRPPRLAAAGDRLRPRRPQRPADALVRPVHPAPGGGRLRGHRPELPRLDRLRQGIRGRQQQGLGRRRPQRPQRRRAHFGGRGDIDPKRVGITGGSYGGYMTLMALCKQPDVLAAGVEFYGMPDLVMDYLLSQKPLRRLVRDRDGQPEEATPPCSASARRCRTSTTSRRRC